MDTVIISGSARKDGNTRSVVTILQKYLKCDHIDLKDYSISYFDYEHHNVHDDFIPLIERISKDYQLLILVTPVYWYSMSAIMKTFFDRLTDLITIKKELGRTLRGKSMIVISNSNGGNLGENFWLPFSMSANYLGITYLGNLHTLGSDDNVELIQAFIDSLELKTKSSKKKV